MVDAIVVTRRIPVLKQAWAALQRVKLRQSQLTEAFARVGADIKLMYLCSGSRFRARLVREAMQTDAGTVAAQYASLMRSASKLCQHRPRMMRAAAPWLLESGIIAATEEPTLAATLAPLG